ncbi:MAG: prepilin-type N-terminal cleavage/methylation domain-containing protein [Mollicutes bacterium]|nr:prepilin-type N-terminal cleavage/methylation domain-containing protein [Mollicutes bacterium]
MRDKKGFTLIELLAIIVILAVVMLIGATAIGPIMARSRKSALGVEGLAAVDAAKHAYQMEVMNESFKSTDSVCFNLAYLKSQDYFDKGTGATGDGYTGSVLVTYSGGNYTYKFWISNGTYIFEGINAESYKPDKAEDGASASATCSDDPRQYNCTGNACTVAP